MTRRDNSAPLSVKGVAGCEFGVAAVAVCGKVRGVYAIPQEEGVTSLLCPQISPIDCGRLHRQPGPGICCLSQLTCALDRAPIVITTLEMVGFTLLVNIYSSEHM